MFIDTVIAEKQLTSLQPTRRRNTMMAPKQKKAASLLDLRLRVQSNKWRYSSLVHGASVASVDASCCLESAEGVDQRDPRISSAASSQAVIATLAIFWSVSIAMGALTPLP